MSHHSKIWSLALVLSLLGLGTSTAWADKTPALVHIEVGGAVPAWMVNRVSASELPNIFTSVKKVVGQPRYASCTAGPNGCK